MFDLGSYELLLMALVALVVIGPKDLPNVLRFAGRWVSRARSAMAQLRSGFDDMVRDSELKDMEKKWQAENERIMREFPDDSATEPAAVESDAGANGAADKGPPPP